jgi:hypothetical protein
MLRALLVLLSVGVVAVAMARPGPWAFDSPADRPSLDVVGALAHPGRETRLSHPTNVVPSSRHSGAPVAGQTVSPVAMVAVAPGAQPDTEPRFWTLLLSAMLVLVFLAIRRGTAPS